MLEMFNQTKNCTQCVNMKESVALLPQHGPHSKFFYTCNGPSNSILYRPQTPRAGPRSTTVAATTVVTPLRGMNVEMIMLNDFLPSDY